MATAELQSTTNLLKKILSEIRTESTASERANLAVIVAVVFALLSVLSIAAAFNANIRVGYQDEKITELRERVDYWTAHATALRAELKTRGFVFDDEKEIE